MICAGVCPNYQLEILSNGDAVRGNPEPDPTDPDHLYSNSVIRFHVLPANLDGDSDLSSMRLGLAGSLRLTPFAR